MNIIGFICELCQFIIKLCMIIFLIFMCYYCYDLMIMFAKSMKVKIQINEEILDIMKKLNNRL
jgi:TRAP-type C4-dicarboxylate transport system permease small subunit